MLNSYRYLLIFSCSHLPYCYLLTLIVTLSIPKSVSLCQWQLLWLTITDNNCQLPDYFLVIPLAASAAFFFSTDSTAFNVLIVKAQDAITCHLRTRLRRRRDYPFIGQDVVGRRQGGWLDTDIV